MSEHVLDFDYINDNSKEYNNESEKDDDIKDCLNVNILPWIEKYRPTTLDGIISHEDIISTLKTFIKSNCLPHLLFYGPPGSGKTSTIAACAKELYGKYYPFMVMELNASDDRGIEVVRTKIKKFVTSKSVFFDDNETNQDPDNIFKLVILDETDAMTDDAQAILRKVVEEFTGYTRFCLICNYIQKIIPALQSRCTKFRFSSLQSDKIRTSIIKIARLEKLKITKSGIKTIISRSNGDMRKVLNILQSVGMSYNTINEKNVNKSIGYPQRSDMEQIISSLATNNFKESYDTINKLKYDKGLSLNDIIQEIHNETVEYILRDQFYDIELSKELLKRYDTNQLAFILDKMRDIEYNQSVNTSDDIQLSALIGIFQLTKKLIIKNKT